MPITVMAIFSCQARPYPPYMSKILPPTQPAGEAPPEVRSNSVPTSFGKRRGAVEVRDASGHAGEGPADAEAVEDGGGVGDEQRAGPDAHCGERAEQIAAQADHEGVARRHRVHQPSADQPAGDTGDGEDAHRKRGVARRDSGALQVQQPVRGEKKNGN